MRARQQVLFRYGSTNVTLAPAKVNKILDAFQYLPSSVLQKRKLTKTAKDWIQR